MKSPMELFKVLSIPVLSLLFALAYLISTFSLPGIAVNYPRGLIVIIVFLSLWLVISELKTISKKRSRDPSEPSDLISLLEFKRPIIAQVALLAYFVIIPYVGFYLSSFIWMIATSMIIDQKMRWRRIGINILICFVFTLCGYLVFKVIFFIPTPEGIWI